ncbi:DUF4893 domain-containing protein [Sphingomonas sp. RB3P16]|uniref:DUF4893 domain-containing protein n=1 Tax=Parasphingomonas frigoris TaxID=3096163 RepID=UPI002FC8A5E3
MRVVSLLLAIALLPSCAGLSQHPKAVAGLDQAASGPSWGTLVTPSDKLRIDGFGDSWQRALAAAPKRLATKVASEGALLRPDTALDLPALPPGPYYCRLVRLGGRAGVTTATPDFCIVEGTARSLSFTKLNGANAPVGWLFPDTDRRQIFLGTFRPAKAPSAPGYKTAGSNDVAGVLERVGPFRWRLALASAAKDAVLDVYELVPVTPKVRGAVPAIPG